MAISIPATRFGEIACRIARADIPSESRRQLFVDLFLCIVEPYGTDVQEGLSRLFTCVLYDTADDAAAGTIKLDSLPAKCTFRKDSRGFWCYLADGVGNLGYGLTPREAVDHRWEYEHQALAYLAEHSADCAVKTTD